MSRISSQRKRAQLVLQGGCNGFQTNKPLSGANCCKNGQGRDTTSTKKKNVLIITIICYRLHEECSMTYFCYTKKKF